MIRTRIWRIRAGLSCRIALLSDLHNADGTEALQRLAQLRPDLIAVTGDFFLGYHALEGDDLLRTQHNILPFLEGCVKLAPTYISLGNHEWMLDQEDLDMIRSTGMTSEAFCAGLLKAKNVAAVPGTAFGPSGEGNIRCCYATALDKLSIALDRIAEYVAENT